MSHLYPPSGGEEGMNNFMQMISAYVQCGAQKNRACPGVHFGEASLFIGVASLLATFTFSKKKDSSGNYIDPVIEDSPNSIIL
jgi:hypothetical protein